MSNLGSEKDIRSGDSDTPDSPLNRSQGNSSIRDNDSQPPTPGTPGRINSLRSTPTHQQRINQSDGNIVPDSSDGMSSPKRNLGTSPYIGEFNL